MKNVSLNGWWRLYVVFTFIWLAATVASYYYSLPKFDEDPEQIAYGELRNQIEAVQRIRDPLELHKEADRLCEEAYNLTKINKNSCMSFMITPDAKKASSNVLMMIHVTKPLLANKIQQVKERIAEEQKPQIIHESIRHLRIALTVPIITLIAGLSLAWIRRGFKGPQAGN
ncbi:hypothetical protein [Aquabacterium sp.]|uniref:hypothetical protein n=1 Tax=Aquabacterium sp. TaxID=1872578 RepID=UPI0025C6219A|nr:hypothetical protein [Aquabacterium sp.]